MSQTIDERIVEMRFENASFEKNISQSISSLDKLESSLKLDGAKSGLEKLGDAAKQVDFSPIGNALETVKGGFSALEVIATGALMKIGSKAADVAGNIANMLTSMSGFNPENILAGWNKFGDKTTSVATLVSQGYDLGTVNAQLERLNWFTDETSYNFVDMVSNIAKFTASGKDLQSSVTALEGIANWAALSGQNAATASRAMFQLSQAMGAGVMRKEDYKSIQNVSMDTDEFRQKALDAAIALGTLKKNADGTYQSLVKNTDAFKKNQFAEHLTQDAWFTSDVMMKVFNDYSAAVDQIYDYSERHGITASQAINELGDSVDSFGLKAFKAAQEARTWSDVVDSVKDAVSTGWMKSFELIIGDYEEAKTLYTQMANDFWDIFASGAEGRNDLLFSGLSTGWKQFLSEGISFEDAFRNRVVDTAREYGIAVDEIIEQSGSFTESLKEGWLSADILKKSVSDLADKLRGMSLEELTSSSIGYTERERDMVLELDEALKNGTLSAEEFAESIARMSGRENLAQSLYNIRDALFLFDEESESAIGIIAVLKEAFAEIFPPMTGDQLYSITEKIKNFTQSLIPTAEKAEQLKNTFKGIFAVFDIGKQAISAIVGGIKTLLGFLPGMGDELLGVTSSFGEYLAGLDETLKKNETFKKGVEAVVDFLTSIPGKINSAFQSLTGLSIGEAFEKISEKVKMVFETISGVFSEIGSVDTSGLRGFIDKIKAHLEPLETLFDGIKRLFSGLWAFIKKIEPALSSLILGAGKVLGKVGDAIKESLSGVNLNSAMDLFNGGILAIIGLKIKGILNNFSGFDISKITSVLDGIRGCFEAYQASLKADVLLKIAGAVAILAASIVVLSLIDSEKLFVAISAISLLFSELMGSMKAFSSLAKGNDFNGIGKLAAAMAILSVAVLIMSSAMKSLSELDWDELIKGIAGISVLSVIMTKVAKELSKNSGEIIKGTGGLILFAVAIRLLVKPLKELGELNWASLIKGLVGIGVLCAELAGFLKLADFDGVGIGKGLGIAIVAGAILILASAVGKFSEMDTGKMIQGLAGVGAVLLEIGLFTRLTGDAKHVISTATGVVILGAAMLIFGSAIEKMGSLSWEELGKGLLAIGVSLAAVALAMNNMPTTTPLIASGMVLVGAALTIIANAIKNMSGLSWEEVGRGLVALSGSLLAIALALNFMKGTIGGSAALLIAAAALAILTPTLTALSGLSWEEIAKGLVALAGSFAVIGIAGAVLAPLTGVIVALCASFALLGAAVLGIGVGLIAAGAGLSAIAAGITLLATAIFTSGSLILEFIPSIISAFGEGLVAFFTVIGNSAEALGEALKQLVLSAVDVLVTCVPEIADGLLQLLSGVLDSLSEYTPGIIDSLFDFIIGAIEGLAGRIPELIQALVNVLISVFQGLGDAFDNIDFGVILKGLEGIGIITILMGALSLVAGLVPGAMLGILGLASVIAELAVVLAAIGLLAQIPGLDWLINEGGQLLEDIGSAIGGFVGSIVGGLLEGATSSLPEIGENLSSFMTSIQPFIDGASRIDSSMMAGVDALSNIILKLTAADLINGITSWITGGSSLTEFGVQLAEFGPYFKAFADSTVGINPASVEASAKALSSISDFVASLPNSGGVVSWFTGDNTLSKFGEELASFGPQFKIYADSLSGIDVALVDSASGALSTISTLLSNLPNSGGVVSWFTGDNTLSKFGEELASFGPNLKIFADSLKDFSFDADKLSSFTLSMGSLGSDGIERFISGISSKSSSVVGVISNILTQCVTAVRNRQNEFQSAGSACATKLIAGLKTNISEATSIISGILEDCLVSINNTYGDFYSSGSYLAMGFAAGIRSSSSDASVAAIEMANAAEIAAKRALDEHSPSKKFYEIGLNAGKGFVNALEYYRTPAYTIGYNVASSASQGAKDAANSFESNDYSIGDSMQYEAVKVEDAADKMKKAIDEVLDDFEEYEKTGKMSSALADYLYPGKTDEETKRFHEAVRNEYDTRKKIDQVLKEFEEYEKNGTMGSALADYLYPDPTDPNAKEFHDRVRAEYDKRNGIIKEETEAIKKDGSEKATDAMSEVLDGCMSTIEERLPEFQEAGKQAAEGFAAGIIMNAGLAAEAASDMASSAIEAAKAELDIHSPSRVLYRIGDYAGRGFINALHDSREDAYEAGADIADYAKDGITAAIINIADYISDGIETEPIIRPVLDLSDLKTKSQSINALFSQRYVAQVSAGFRKEEYSEDGGLDEKLRTGNTYTFTQNNYSPKALSRIEIYRQTRNQFSAMKGLVEV